MRGTLAVVILLAAACRLWVDWRMTIGQGYAFRPGTVGGIVAALWPEGHGRLMAFLGDGVAGSLGGFVLALPAALLLAAAGYGLWITRPGRRRA